MVLLCFGIGTIIYLLSNKTPANTIGNVSKIWVAAIVEILAGMILIIKNLP